MRWKTHSTTVRKLLAIVLLGLFTRPLLAQQAEEITINVKGLQTVALRSNAHVNWSMSGRLSIFDCRMVPTTTSPISMSRAGVLTPMPY